MKDIAREAAYRAVNDLIPRAEGERLHRLLLRCRAKRRALRIGLRRLVRMLAGHPLEEIKTDHVRAALIELLHADERRDH